MSLQIEMISSMTILPDTEIVSSSVPTPTPAEDTTQAQEKPPPRVYDLYSWKTKAPHTRLVYIRDWHTAELEIAWFKPGPCGFDLEWKPNWRKGQRENPVALVQLANDDTVLLIQITAMQEFPPSLQRLLWDSTYIKCGVGIQGDVRKLWNNYGVSTRNCVDLALLARTVDNARWKGKYNQPIGLARLCETYEELSLHKGKITRSNWEAVLNEAQQQYAANDCHSGLTLYKILFPMTQTLNLLPLPSFYSFDLYEGYAYVPSAGFPEILWEPHNPFYDPGPPPEPKPPKEKKERKDKQAQEGENGAASADGSGNAAEGSTASSATQKPRPRHVRSAEGQTGTQRPPHQRHGQQGQRGSGNSHRGYYPLPHQQHGAGHHAAPPAIDPAQPNGDSARNQHPYPDAGSHRGFRGRGRGRPYRGGPQQQHRY